MRATVSSNLNAVCALFPCLASQQMSAWGPFIGTPRVLVQSALLVDFVAPQDASATPESTRDRSSGTFPSAKDRVVPIFQPEGRLSPSKLILSICSWRGRAPGAAKFVEDVFMSSVSKRKLCCGEWSVWVRARPQRTSQNVRIRGPPEDQHQEAGAPQIVP